MVYGLSAAVGHVVVVVVMVVQAKMSLFASSPLQVPC